MHATRLPIHHLRFHKLALLDPRHGPDVLRTEGVELLALDELGIDRETEKRETEQPMRAPPSPVRAVGDAEDESVFWGGGGREGGVVLSEEGEPDSVHYFIGE